MQEQEKAVAPVQTPDTLDGPPCMKCGAIMQQTGHCFTCRECGETSGCS
jgi:tRNA(Ile2) C34 agmatinyltransferase TiaS